MMITDKNRGMLFLGLGVFFAVIFLVGGGVLTATNGGYWTLVFLAAYLVGLAVFGLPVYKSATVAICNSHGANRFRLVTFADSCPRCSFLFRSCCR